MKVTEDLIAGLVRLVLAKDYENPTEIPDFHHDLWSLCCSDYEQVAIAAPRGHAKSTAVTGAYAMACLLMRERKYALIISDTEEQSAEFILEMKEAFTENVLLRQIYGIDRVIRDRTTDIIVRFKDGETFRVLGKGSEQKIRGRKWRGTRPDLIICDDLENEELTSSDERRMKFKKWFFGSVIPAGSSNCVLRYVGTILHFDSLLESFMPSEEVNGVTLEIDRTPLREFQIRDRLASVRYMAHPDESDYSMILWPDRWPEESLRRKRQQYVERGIPEIYAQEYLNRPISSENAFFREQDIVPMDGEARAMKVECYGSADLAIEENNRAAYSVIFAGGMDDKRRIQVRDRRKGRWDADRIVDEMFELVQRNGIKELFLEAENIAKSVRPQIEERMRKTGIYFTLHMVNPSKNKESRAKPLQAMTRVGQVIFDDKTEWFPNLRNEMLRFPKGPFKDDVDALGLLAASIQMMVEPPTPEEDMEADYQEEAMFIGYGRCGVTGY